MTITELRRIAQGISEQRAAMTAEADRLTMELLKAPQDFDTNDLVTEMIQTERWVDDLAEQEHHAWDAVAEAEQMLHEQWMDEVDNL